MSTRASSVAAWALPATALLFAATGAALAVAGGADVAAFYVLVSALILTAAVVGRLVSSRRPENPIGWIFSGFAVWMGLSELAAGIADVAPDDGTHGFGQAAAWFANWSWVALPVLAIFVLLLFPDGTLLSRRWRPVAWTGATGSVLLAVGTAVTPGPLSDYEQIENPVPLDGHVSGVLLTIGSLLSVGALLAALASVVVRYRRADDTGRQQIKWLAAAGVVAVVALVTGITVAILVSEAIGNSLVLVGILTLPVGVAIAILRHRLYDVDRLISRSLTYALVTAVLAGAYVVLVLAGQAVFSSFAGGSDLAIAGSTLVVAALFLPLRGRVQRLVDRRFYRRRYDAQQTLSTFGARVREQVELDGLRSELEGIVLETMQPSSVSLWLREGASR